MPIRPASRRTTRATATWARKSPRTSSSSTPRRRRARRSTSLDKPTRRRRPSATASSTSTAPPATGRTAKCEVLSVRRLRTRTRGATASTARSSSRCRTYRVITATVTDPAYNTSEFSACKVATGARRRPDLHRQHDGLRRRRRRLQRGDCTILEAITAANATPDTDTIDFAIPGEAPFVIETPGTLSVTGRSRSTPRPSLAILGRRFVALDGQSDNLVGFQILRRQHDLAARDVRA